VAPVDRELQDLDAPYWTRDQAVRHLGITRRTLRRYISAGLPTYFAGTLVKPDELLRVWKTRRNQQRDTRAQ
jgi:hypothetical protein